MSARKYDTADDLLEKCAAEKGYIVFLDGVEDPFNLGYALRSLYAFGVTGIILPKRDFSSCAGVLARSSAGASELCPTALAELDTPEKRLSFIDKLRSLGIALDCAAVSSSSIPADEYVYPSPFILFIGGEKRGFLLSLVENANVLLHIRMQEIRFGIHFRQRTQQAFSAWRSRVRRERTGIKSLSRKRRVQRILRGSGRASRHCNPKAE